jgi:uncharacterized cupin superfamily protein
MHEAQIVETETGRIAQGDGWFILNVREASWESMPRGGSWCSFEAPDAPHTQIGIGIHVLWPGDTPGFYHAESDQEGFLVLSGECVAIIEGQERRMGPWDYFHCPAGTLHIAVGAGDGPCALLMVGGRSEGKTYSYPMDPVAARYDASTSQPGVTSSREAYAGRDRTITRNRAPWPAAGDDAGEASPRGSFRSGYSPRGSYPRSRNDPNA